ncbi:MAG TPA: SCO family protein [Candidatus Limnocylindrales bacterium]|nr:SCO family protein [Candidatus Limnocylindrales bacterium]
MLDRTINGPRALRAASSLILCFAVSFVLLLAACSSKSADNARRFHLHGKVISINKDASSADIDADAMPGYMDAMAMSYSIPDPRALASIGPGDEITADVVVIDDVAHLENIVVVKRAAKPDPASSSNFHMPQPGDIVPDFALIDQNGKQLRLRSFHGDALLVTFIYTRCPYADFCPKVSADFAQIYAALRKQPASSKVRLLSVSFDPVHDTPAVLRQYAASFRNTTGTTRPFDHWEFAAVRKSELPDVAKFFGLYYSEKDGQIIHSISTSLISPDGKIVTWLHDNNWQPETLLTQAEATLPGAQLRTAALGK